jgi:hypothetical protein
LQPVHRIHLSVEGLSCVGYDLGPPRSDAQFLPARQLLAGRSLKNPPGSFISFLAREFDQCEPP